MTIYDRSLERAGLRAGPFHFEVGGGARRAKRGRRRCFRCGHGIPILCTPDRIGILSPRLDSASPSLRASDAVASNVGTGFRSCAPRQDRNPVATTGFGSPRLRVRCRCFDVGTGFRSVHAPRIGILSPPGSASPSLGVGSASMVATIP